MKTVYSLIILLVLASCQSGESDLAAKKKALDEAKKEYQDLREKITTLEKELQELDPEFAKETSRAILVSTFPVEKKPFIHKVEVRGTVQSRRNVLISAETAGTIQRIHVKEGDRVSKGQVLVSLDAEIIRNNIAELKTSLELAASIYEKQSKLWDQKIGTEVQYLQAKNNKESLERRLSTAYAQLDQAIVKAPFSGSVDEVPAREGELASPGVPLVRITSPQDMYINADVSERFIGTFSPGDKVEIFFPVKDVRLESEIASVGKVINPENRTFSVEVKLPRTDWTFQPNQVTILHLNDYSNQAALSVPTRLIQKDNEGQFVYGVEKKDNQQVAVKHRVKTGMSFNGETEILEGVKEGVVLVDKGYRDLAEGVEVAIATSSASSGKVAKN